MKRKVISTQKGGVKQKIIKKVVKKVVGKPVVKKVVKVQKVHVSESIFLLRKFELDLILRLSKMIYPGIC